MKKSTTRKCQYCGGKGHIAIYKFLPASKMAKLMQKYKLTQAKIAELCGLSQTGVCNWFSKNKKTKGVKEDYFTRLAKKGFK